MFKLGKDLWAAIIVAIAMLLGAGYLEVRHSRMADKARQHEDDRTWRAVDSVKAAIAPIKADTDTLKLMLRNFVWIIGIFTLKGVH